MKYHLFLDETGDHGLTHIDKNFPVFLLCGCLFSDQELKSTGNSGDMLTGDNSKTAQVIAAQLGIDEIFSQLEPQNKQDIIKKFKQQGALVMMAGDGISNEFQLCFGRLEFFETPHTEIVITPKKLFPSRLLIVLL